LKRAWVITCLTLLAPSVTVAKTPPMQKGFHDTLQRPGQDEPGKTRTPEQVRAIKDARAEVRRAESALLKVRRRIDAEFKKSTTWIEAQASLDRAQGAYDALRLPILETLHASKPYQDAVAARQAAMTQKDAIQKNSTAPADEKAAAGQAFLDASAVLTKLEMDALNADENTVIARDLASAEAAKLNDLKEKFDADLPTHPDFASAKAEVEAKRQTLIAAEKA